MDEDNKGQIKQEDDEKKEKVEKSIDKNSNVPKSGGGVVVGLQFLTLFVVIAMIGVQAFQLGKIEDLRKMLNEEGKITSTDAIEEIKVPEVSLSDIATFPLVTASTFNITDGKDTRTLILTVNLGLNKKAKSFKNTNSLLNEKIEIAKEIIEGIIGAADVSDLDGAGKEYNLKTKIITQLSKQFDTDAIVAVYFSDKFIA